MHRFALKARPTALLTILLAASLAAPLGALAGGCTALVNPDQSRLGGGVDGGTGPRDSGTPRDTGVPPRDAGPPRCTADLPRCDGDLLLACVDEMVFRRDCAAENAYCGIVDGNPVCAPRICTPGAGVCAPGGGAVRVCNSRGSSYVETPCDNGCADGACIPDPGPCDDPPRLFPNTPQTIVTCDLGDSFRYQRDANCASTHPGQDFTYRIEIASAGTYVFEAIDRDAVAAVDTALYLRTACEDPTTQVGCNDNIPCLESEFAPRCTTPETEYRQSRLTLALEPGTYFLTVDTLEWRDADRSYECGRLELVMRRSTGGLPIP